MDVRVLGRDYDPDGGFRLGDDLAPFGSPPDWDITTAALAALADDHATGRDASFADYMLGVAVAALDRGPA